MYDSTPAQAGQVLHDTSPNGRERPWAKHKADAQLMSYALGMVDPRAGLRVQHCADSLYFRRREDGALRLSDAHFCRVRMCPVCQWRRSLKMYGQLRQVVQALDADQAAAGRKPYGWLLLTLTIANCSGAGLSATLDTLAAGWDRMGHTAAWRRAALGTLRCVEVTYNRATGTYHPHMHVLVCVKPSYFSSRDYLSQASWSDMWRQACRLDYNPIVDVRRVRGRDGLSADPGACAEVAKYATKPGDYLDPSDLDQMAEVVGTLHKTCAYRRFAAWTGLLRRKHHDLHLDDAEDGDLLHIGTEDAESDAGAAAWRWDWYAGPRLYIGGIEHDIAR